MEPTGYVPRRTTYIWKEESASSNAENLDGIHAERTFHLSQLSRYNEYEDDTSSSEQRRSRWRVCRWGCLSLAGFVVTLVGVVLAVLAIGRARGEKNKSLLANLSGVVGDYANASASTDNGSTHQARGLRRTAVSTKEVGNATEPYLFALNVD
ncbi:uncharacterized protein LOC144153319 [Haemaphysalis longicornis]